MEKHQRYVLNHEATKIGWLIKDEEDYKRGLQKHELEKSRLNFLRCADHDVSL